MSLIPDEQHHLPKSLNMAPLVDLLFLLLAVLIIAFITRAAIIDTEFKLVKAPKEESSSLTPSALMQGTYLKIFADGTYTLTCEGKDYTLNSSEEISALLKRFHDESKLDPSKHPVLLKIERASSWELVADAILKVKKEGYEVKPLFEQEMGNSNL